MQLVAYFSAKTKLMVIVRTRIDSLKSMPKGAYPKHNNWMHYFLKLYHQEDVDS
jgi:hypothetical protein